MTELARQCFASLNRDKFGCYIILIDGYFEKYILAPDDETAKLLFNNWLRERAKAREEGK